jgi:hypothetical protein
MKEEARPITKDEAEDIWYTMAAAEKLNDQRAIGVSLEIIREQIGYRASGRSENKIEVNEELVTRIIARCSQEATPTMQSNK